MKRRDFLRTTALGTAAMALAGGAGADDSTTNAKPMSATRDARLPRRRLGKTDLEISNLGFGGFHQVEVSQDVIERVMARYLAAGGTYVETARWYGAGTSEKKVGKALKACKADVVLASKSPAREQERAWRELNESMENLGVDYINVYFFHNISKAEDLDTTCADKGAVKAFERARDEKMIGHMAMSSHWPMFYIEGAKRLPIEAVLIWGNYLDYCNFPEIPNEVLPFLKERDIGLLFMKPVGDGYLYRSVRDAFRYADSFEPTSLVSGFNSIEMLESDLAVCCDATPVTREEVGRIRRDAPELGDYVCRQCGRCTVCDDGDTLKRVFELEGKVDRQMDDRRPVDAGMYALRERLKNWFGSADRARELYASMGRPGPKLAEGPLRKCRYGLDAQRKLQIAHAKLTDGVDVRLI